MMESLYEAGLLSCILESSSITELASEEFCSLFLEYNLNLGHLQKFII